MAGGTSIWWSKDAKTDPRQIYNFRLLYLVITLSWAGCFYGFDTGNIGGIVTLDSFKKAFGLVNIPQQEIDNRKVSSPTLMPSVSRKLTHIYPDVREPSLPWCLLEARLELSLLLPHLTGLAVNGRFSGVHIRRWCCVADDRQLRDPSCWTFYWRIGGWCDFHVKSAVLSRQDFSLPFRLCSYQKKKKRKKYAY